LLDVSELTSYTNFLLILTATSDRHARALADHLIEEMRGRKVRPLGVEGHAVGQWILVDFGDVIAHIFQETVREYYDLDGLWIDAASVPIEETG
jgi:ribosome-associated protein